MSALFYDSGVVATGQKVMLATTAYESPDASYTFSIQRSREELHQDGIETAYLLLSGNCHVDDARNHVVQEFLLSDCTDLVFLDADVSWKPDDLLELCRVRGVEIAGGVYPYRIEDKWRRDSMPFLPSSGARPQHDGLLPVDGLPTGFMRIRRHVLEAMAEDAPKYWKKKDARSKVPVIFERTLEGETRWGGDLNFCNKAAAMGFTIFALPELRLGHAAKTVVSDSLGAHIRRVEGSTLKFVADQVKQNTETPAHFYEACDRINNPWAAPVDVLALCTKLARLSDGPILEVGSGLTTVLMAAANPDDYVYCLEHSDVFASSLIAMAKEAGVSNIAVVRCDLKDGWYDIQDELPESFGLGFVDGPPHQLGDRTIFMERYGSACRRIVIDDADAMKYTEKLKTWAENARRPILYHEGRAMIIGNTDDTIDDI